ncbi:MAG: hypothetical protein ACJ79A_05035 [Gemmatimonadaceae bacterium]
MPFRRLPRARALAAALAVSVAGITPARLLAQAPTDSTRGEAPTAPRIEHAASRHHYWRRMTAGFASSILAHEGAHLVTAVAVGGRPSIGFDKGRPTVYSGLDARIQKRQQFLFSSMGLNVQALLDEGILDVPHRGGGAFERGVLAGGIATALFYVTIGRSASVSDVDFMTRTSSLSKGDITLIYGGVAVMHAVRIHYDARYANFFVRPAPAGEPGLRVGMNLE